MKIEDIKESAGDNAIRAWCAKHIDRFDPKQLDIEDGEITYWVECNLKDCSVIEYPFAEVLSNFTVNKGRNNAITSLKNCPRIVQGNFDIIGQPLKNLEGCPDEVKSYLTITNCGLESFEGFKTKVGNKTLDFTQNNFKSLKGIHKHIPEATRIFLEHNPIKEAILGLLLIEELNLNVVFGDRNRMTWELNAAVEILWRWKGKGKKGVLAAQEEMENEEEYDLSGYADL